jgi:hypothetical protein
MKILCCLILAALCAFAQLPKVESVTLEDSGSGPAVAVKVLLQNNSGKEITAYDITVTGVYADGKQATQETSVDLAWVLVNERLGWPLPPNSTFRPGESTTMSLSLPRSPTGLLASATAVVSTAVYADKSAAGKSAEIQQIAISRKNDAGLFRSLAGDLAELIAAPDSGKRFSELQANFAQRDGIEARRYLSVFRGVITPIAGDKERLKSAQQAYQARAEVLAEHAHIQGVQK